MKINKLIILTVLSFIAFGCSEDFLDEPAPTDSITENVVFSSPEVAESVLSGIIRLSRGQFTSGHDAGGINSMHYARVVKGDDIIQGPTWFTFDYVHENREPNYRRTNFSWDFSYEIISQTNTLINGLETSSFAEADQNRLLSQALAFRAYYYHQLILEFAHAYTYDPDAEAIPIYTSVVTEGAPLSTTREVYDLILDDLTRAKELATTSRLDKSYINVNVVNAILSDVYLCMENWEGALNAAEEAAAGYSLNASEYTNGFNSLDSSEWIWGYYQYDDQTNYYYGAPHTQADHTVTSYQGTYVNNAFVNRFSDSDVRRRFIGGYYGGSTSNWNYWITNKFSFNDFGIDFPLYRVAEMLLVEAEAKARLGDENGAREILFDLQSNRDPNATMSNNSGEALINEILWERRKELYGEKGIEWFDAKRLGKGINRTGNHRVFVELSPNDNRFVLKIPESETDANSNFDSSVNDDIN